MHERFRGRLEQIGRYIRGEKHEHERPHYIRDDFELLGHIDFVLQKLMNRASFRHLQTALQKSNFNDVVDIGASSNFLRGVVFFNATEIKAIDPAYKWYDYEAESPSAPRPYPDAVFGGKPLRQEMEGFLQYTCRNIQIPAKMNPNGVTLITGERHAQRRQFELIPEDANKWLLDQQSQSIGNFVVFRVFPSASAWGRIISSLKEGGILLTTGYGRLDPIYVELLYSETEGLEFEPDISQGGGINICNTSLPLNGNSEAIGLTSIAQFGQINFYKKIRHFDPDIVSQAILENR